MALTDLARTMTGTKNEIVIGVLDPDAQLSTNTETLLAGSEFDARPWNAVQIALMCATNAVTVKLYGSPAASVAITEEIFTWTLSAGTTTLESLLLTRSGYGTADTAPPHAAAPLTHRYYKLTIDSTSDGQHGTVTAFITGYY